MFGLFRKGKTLDCEQRASKEMLERAHALQEALLLSIRDGLKDYDAIRMSQFVRGACWAAQFIRAEAWQPFKRGLEAEVGRAVRRIPPDVW